MFSFACLSPSAVTFKLCSAVIYVVVCFDYDGSREQQHFGSNDPVTCNFIVNLTKLKCLISQLLWQLGRKGKMDIGQ